MWVFDKTKHILNFSLSLTVNKNLLIVQVNRKLGYAWLSVDLKISVDIQ